MKKIILSLSLLAVFSVVMACSLSDIKKFSVVSNLEESNGKFGTKGVVTNAQYAEFLATINKQYGEGSPKSIFVTIQTTGAPTDAVKGLSFGQVKEFCIWATEETNRKLFAYKAEHPSESLPRLVMFRLPNEQELKAMKDVKSTEMSAAKGIAVAADKSTVKYTDADKTLTFRVIVEVRN